ncbi:MAG TPA: hypothetical protein VGU68_11765 [Ktedonobacteraceae bacterium]|nr:hypothetical protein [Ktedonobacteraceae bacterium]
MRNNIRKLNRRRFLGTAAMILTARQHHALLVDQHGDFCGSSLLGEQVRSYQHR